MTWKTARSESLTSIDICMDVLEVSGILFVFSLWYHNSTLCMERGRPLKLHLLWGRKRVFLITIYHKCECKNTFVVQAGGGIFSLQNSFLPKRKSGECSLLSGVIWHVWSSPEALGTVSWCWDCSYRTVCLQTHQPASHLLCSSTSRIPVWPIISILSPFHHIIFFFVLFSVDFFPLLSR